MTRVQHQPNEPCAASTGDYERTDVNVRRIGVAALALTALVLTVIFATALLFGWWRDDGRAANMAISFFEQPLQAPPSPTLQVDPAAQLEELQQYENRLLTEYRWINTNDGIVGIPIDRAMTLLAELHRRTRAGAHHEE